MMRREETRQLCLLRWQRNKRDGRGLFAFTEAAGNVVECKALSPADGELLVVVLPRGEDEELTAGTGFHASAAWLRKVCEAVLL